MKPRDYFIMAGVAALLLILSLFQLATNLAAARAAKQAVEISTTNTNKLDRNYRRWDEFAKANPNVKVPSNNGEHP